MWVLAAVVLFEPVSALSAQALPPYKPDASELLASYQRSANLFREYSSRDLNARVQTHWYGPKDRVWFTLRGSGDATDYMSADPANGKVGPLFDQARLATALGGDLHTSVDPNKLPLLQPTFSPDGKTFRFNARGQGFEYDIAANQLKEVPAMALTRPRREPPWTQYLNPPDPNDRPSPDHQWVARIVDNNVQLETPNGNKWMVTRSGTDDHYFARLEWTPDSKHIIAIRVTKGDRHPAYNIESSPEGGGLAVLHTRIYDRPGDKVDTFDISLIDPVTDEVRLIQAEPVDYGDMPYFRWMRDGRHFTYEKMDRGYGRWRVIEVDSETGQTKTLIDDHPSTFVDSTSQYIHYCANDEMIWRSERDGWGHLYLVEPDGTIADQITKGDWVVRGVVSVDEKARQIVFEGSGMNAGEDPYFIHYYRVGFDGAGLICLTPEPANHQAELSPDGKYLVDSYSTATQPHVYVLRDAYSGKLVCTLAKEDISQLLASGWRPPEPFVAKGRDGKTDIWGIIYRPSHLDPTKSYPILEDIYAGPQDSFVPKSFMAFSRNMALAELGFIVVQCDGMGTRNRSKAFQDVEYKNLKDAGFPDRILWMKAVSAKYPYADDTRVGVFGTSAGGQNAAAAVLFHPEFYKAAVASCGCHDNRMDKLWWNEQYMGYPIGPQYAESSNIDNAWRLKGKLMLFVAEMDTNVPPESTYRFVDALMKAHKDFQFLVIPGSDHTDGGPYGERKRRDFFVKNLLGVDAPIWNEQTDGFDGIATR